MAAGITSAFIMQSTPKTKIVVIEIDEGSDSTCVKRSYTFNDGIY